MKIRVFLFVLLSAGIFSGLYAQPKNTGWGDAEVARQYVDWARQAIDEDRWDEASAALERAADFANVSSDVSYLLAIARSHNKTSRTGVVEALNTALETNRWITYSKNHALLLKAEQLIAMREYDGALSAIGQTAESADAAMLRLLALRGLALETAPGYDSAQALARFRSLMLSAMDRYPRDTRPLRIFFEYARNRNPEPSELPSGDFELLELALRRLNPFLLETDPDLAWMAAPFMRNTEEARRLVAAYRAQMAKPLAASIPSALNLGLVGDIDAVEELFSAQTLEKNLIIDVFNLLRGEEGRNLFTKKLLSFSGVINSDDDRDEFIDSAALFNSGVIREFAYDRDQSNDFYLRISFDAGGVPVSSEYPSAGEAKAQVKWERYPSVERITLDKELFEFRPADFQFAPIKFIELCGSQTYSGLAFPVILPQYIEVTRRSLVSFCESMTRPSAEFDGAQEQIFFKSGIPLRSVETIDGKQVSVMEFEGGLPVVQRLDMDVDGRMETLRRFRRPGANFLLTEAGEMFDFRSLIASTESDWAGDGRFKTGEVYRQDGSVVYSWDMDGSGEMNYSETETGKE